MVLALEQALHQALESVQPTWTLPFSELIDLDGDGAWCARATGPLEVTAGPDRVRVQGRLTGQVPRECARCLGHYLESLTVTVTDLCLIDASAPAGLPAGFDEDDEVWRAAPDGLWSLTELVRQALLLALPTRADCGEACATSRAGRLSCRRADHDDPASDAAVDPRLAVLRQLFANPTDDGEADGRPEAESQ